MKSISNIDLIQQIALYVLTARAFFKPVCSFWNKYLAPYIKLRPTEKLLKHPVYKAITYVIDWALSIKLPQEKK